MVAPAIGQVAAEFAITSDAVVAMTISVFILAHGRSRLSAENLPLKIDAITSSLRPIGFRSAVRGKHTLISITQQSTFG